MSVFKNSKNHILNNYTVYIIEGNKGMIMFCESRCTILLLYYV